MSSLVSSSDLNILSGIYGNFFDTFARTIIVYKESIKTPIQNPNIQNFSYGFGMQQAQQGVTFQQVTGVFQALINYTNNQEQELITDANVKSTPGEVIIKVQLPCRNFINNGKTEKINIDGRDFEVISEERAQTILNSQIFRYELQSIDK